MSNTVPLHRATYRYFSHHYSELGLLRFLMGLPWLIYGLIEGEYLHQTMSKSENNHLYESAKFERGDSDE